MKNPISLIRNKLAIQMVVSVSLIALVPLAIVTYLSYENVSKEFESLAWESLRGTARRQSDNIKVYLKGEKDFVVLLAGTADVVQPLKGGSLAGDVVNANELKDVYLSDLKKVVDQFNFRELILVREDGEVVLSVGGDEAFYGNVLEGGGAIARELRRVFRGVSNNAKPKIFNIVKGVSGNAWAFHIGAPVFDEGKFLGVLVVRFGLDNVFKVTSDYMGLEETGETLFIVELEDGVKIINPTRFSQEKLSQSEQSERLKSLNAALISDGDGEALDYRGEVVFAAWEHFPDLDWDWGLFTKIDRAEVLRPVLVLRQWTLVAGFITLGIVLLGAILVTVYITRPIAALKEIASRIAKGDLDCSVGKGTNNEIGELYDAIGVMAKNLKLLVTKVRESGGQVALTSQDIVKSVVEQARVAKNTGASALEITSSARKISATANELEGTMKEVSDVAQATALLAESGIDGLHTMEVSMGELSVASTAVSTQLELIQRSAGRIGGIISTMTKVADQTNLLSLNAAIEARKAGDFGRGFKVVAREIRRLADQVAGSTLEIEVMIGEMLKAVEKGVESMGDLSSKVSYGVKEITNVSTHIGNVIQQVQGLPPRFEMVLQGMESQVEGADQIKESITRMSLSTQDMVRALEMTERKLTLLEQSAGSLETEISDFSMN